VRLCSLDGYYIFIINFSVSVLVAVENCETV